MVKSIIVIFVLTNVMMCFSAVTNVSSIVGMELTEGLLDEIASRNRTDLDHVVLGSLKGAYSMRRSISLICCCGLLRARIRLRKLRLKWGKNLQRQSTKVQ